MFKIGAFSQLTGVTIKALRYYDRVGLLKPAEVDRFTGYRYYTVDQIDRLNRILALKDLGLSLDEIGLILHDNPPAAEIRGMLRLKQAQLRQAIAEDEARLARVEARLRQIEREGQAPAHEVVVRQIPDLYVLAVRAQLAGPWEIAPFFRRVAAGLSDAQVAPTGPWVARYHHGEYREYDLDVEAAIPVAASAPAAIPFPDGGGMQTCTLPTEQMAVTLCRMESQYDVYAANRDLCNWIVENGYRIAYRPVREVYPEAPRPGQPVIFEVQVPVERLG